MSEIIIKNDKIRKGMIFMDEATLERRLHLNMTLIGGFMVGYGVINRHDILHRLEIWFRWLWMP